MIGSKLGLHRLLIGGVLAAGVVVSGAVVTGSSYSVFSASTGNAANNWTSGTVAISNDSSTALFTATGLKPGSTGTRCLVVTSTGSLASTIKLYATSYSAPSGTTPSGYLAAALNLVITQGTGGSFAGGCSGFTPLSTGSAVYSGTLANFGSTVNSFSAGTPTSGAWTPTGSGSESRTYQIQYTLDSAATSSSQGGSVNVGFTWEAQNN